MPNTGRPSRGCQECKDRKVRCDNTSPVCRRCQRNNRQCSGCLSETDVAFRNTLSSAGTPQSGSASSKDTSRSPSSSLMRPMKNDWLGQALCMFFDDYVIPLDESTVGFGFYQGLPELVGREDTSSCLQHAVSAVSLASLSCKSSLDYLLVEARRRYGLALSTMKESLSEPDQLSKDSTMATIMCLDTFEVMTGEKPWSCHVDMFELLLRARPLEKLKSSDSKALNHQAHSYLQMRNLTQRCAPSEDAEKRAKSLDRGPEARDHLLLVHQTCKIIAKADQITRGVKRGPDCVITLINIINEAISTSQAFEVWSRKVRGVYQYENVSLPFDSDSETARGSPMNSSIHVYSSLIMGALWNIHRTSRIQLNRTIIECIEMLENTSPHRPELAVFAEVASKASERTQEIINDIFASIPYHLGEIDHAGNLQLQNRNKKAVGGLYLLFPLMMLLREKHVKNEQATWVKRRLLYIKHAVGIHRELPSV